MDLHFNHAASGPISQDIWLGDKRLSACLATAAVRLLPAGVAAVRNVAVDDIQRALLPMMRHLLSPGQDNFKVGIEAVDFLASFAFFAVRGAEYLALE